MHDSAALSRFWTGYVSLGGQPNDVQHQLGSHSRHLPVGGIRPQQPFPLAGTMTSAALLKTSPSLPTLVRRVGVFGSASSFKYDAIRVPSLFEALVTWGPVFTCACDMHAVHRWGFGKTRRGSQNGHEAW